jgi:hypothetical protein
LRILRVVVCGDPPRRILVSADGHTPQWLTEECCGDPPPCNSFSRLVPCEAESPDPACNAPPGKGELYVCNSLPCSNGTGVWSDRPNIGIYHEGRCWIRSGDNDIPLDQIPPGSDVIAEGTVDCTNGCAEARCGELHYAQAVPCDPNYNGPRPLYCPAGLPWQCNTVNPSLWFGGAPNMCFTFRRDAPTNPYPANTPVLYFPPDHPAPLQTCCDCTFGCFRIPELVSLFVENYFPPESAPRFPGCCCGDTTNATVFTTGSGFGENYARQFAGGPLVRTRRVDWSWAATATQGNNTVQISRRTREWNTDGVLLSDNTEDLPVFVPINCPLAFWYGEGVTPGASFAVPPVYFTESHTRTCTHVTASVSYENQPELWEFSSPYARGAWTSEARLLGMIAEPGCSNTNCDDAGPQPVVGLGGAGGGRTMPTDPNVAAWVQRAYGGCRGCGESPNPL